jgi:hypothetical protein
MMKIKKKNYQFNVPSVQENILKGLLGDSIEKIQILHSGTFQEYLEYLNFIHIYEYRNETDFLLNDINCLIFSMKSGNEISFIHNEESDSASIELRIETENVEVFDKKDGQPILYYKLEFNNRKVTSLFEGAKMDLGFDNVFNHQIKAISILKRKGDERHSARPYEKGVLLEFENNVKLLIGYQMSSNIFDFTLSIVDQTPKIAEVVFVIF